MELTFPLFAGIIAAMLHVISGPDHLAAVTPFAIETKRKAWKIGLFWGFGHLLSMLFIGVLFLIFKELIPVERISEHSEQLVGIVLIGLGIWVFIKIFREKINKNNYVYNIKNSINFEDLHISDLKKGHNHKRLNFNKSAIASLSVGFIHGLAGVAHFLLFLPVIGFSSIFDSIKYIIGFGIGTLIAMIAFAMVIGEVSNYFKKEHNETFFKGVRLSGGLFAFIIGWYWVI